jgi:hypothetical protein
MELAAATAALGKRALTPNLSFDSVRVSPAAGSSPGDTGRASASPPSAHGLLAVSGAGGGSFPPGPSTSSSVAPAPGPSGPTKVFGVAGYASPTSSGPAGGSVGGSGKWVEAVSHPTHHMGDASQQGSGPSTTASSVLALLSTIFMPFSELSNVVAGGAGTARPAEFRKLHHTLRL